MANTTSGTYTFDKTFAIDDVIMESYERIGLVGTAGNQLRSARRSLNLLFSEWGNRGIHYWAIGSTNIDLVIYIDHIPKIGETVIGGESQVIFGGKGANQAVAAKKAGSDVKFITQLGDDNFGNELIKYFKSLDFPEKYLLVDMMRQLYST